MAESGTPGDDEKLECDDADGVDVQTTYKRSGG